MCQNCATLPPGYARVPPHDYSPIRVGKWFDIKPRSSSGNLRKPQTSHDCSPTKKRLRHFHDRFQPGSCRGYTDLVSDWSEATSALLVLITDYLKHQCPIFVVAFNLNYSRLAFNQCPIFVVAFNLNYSRLAFNVDK